VIDGKVRSRKSNLFPMREKFSGKVVAYVEKQRLCFVAIVCFD